MRLDKFASIVWNVLIFIGLTLIAITVLYPILYTVSGAFTPGRSIAAMSPVPFADGFSTSHFSHLFSETLFFKWFSNSFIIALSVSAGTVVLASISGYIFSRFQFVFRGGMLTTMLVLQIFPSFVGMIAIYVILLRIGALDTLWGLILVYLAGNLPYSMWMVKSYMDNIPRGLDEAARLDGASHFRVYAQIILPIARPILTFLAVTTFAAPWMDFIFPKLVLRSPEQQTLALGLISFVSEKNSDFTTFAAGAITVAIPFMIFFLATQKTLITSLSSGALKE